jgi:hypothetical protein
MAMRDFSVTVPLGAELKRFVEEQARREHRSTAGQLRHWAELQHEAVERGAGGSRS